MEFDKSRVFTALNADELKVGSIVYLHSNLAGLKELVINEPKSLVRKIKTIRSANEEYRFCDEDNCISPLAYLISEPEEKKLTEDEELAEEYAEDFVKDKYGGNRHNAEVQKEKLFLKIGFRDGLKAGKPRWHDLLEDPTDIPPKKDDTYSVEVWAKNARGNYGTAVFSYACLKDDGNYNHWIGTKPVLWTELPKFEVENER